MEFGKIYVAPARESLVRSDAGTVQLREFDYFEPTTMPPMFFSMVNDCFRFEDYPLLDIILPASSKENYHEQELEKRIATLLKLRGVCLDAPPVLADHFVVVQNMIYEATQETYTRDEMEQEFGVDEFSFATEDVLKYLRVIGERVEKPVVLLFFTEIGFFRVHDDDIDMNNAVYVIVVSKTEAFVPVPGKVKVLDPQNFFGERRAGFTFFPVIRFENVNGVFHPRFVESSIAHFLVNSTNFPTRLDGLTYPLEQLSGRAQRSVGLIGRNSVIKKHLSHPKMQVDVLDVEESVPFIGVYLSKTAFVYYFLYLPDDLPPSNPLFVDVTKWASAFMHRVCSRTLFLTEPTVFEIKETNRIGGIPPTTGVRFCGSYSTALVVHQLLANSIGPMGRDVILFKNFDEVRMWRHFVCRRYQSCVVRGGHDASQLTLNEAVVLMNEDPQGVLANVVGKVTELSAVDNKVRLAHWKMEQDPENNQILFEEACNEKMNLLKM